MADNQSRNDGGSPQKRLGKGLAALIGDLDLPTPVNSQTDVSKTGLAFNPDRKVPIDHIGPNPKNPRRDFVESDLNDLANSIREHGIMQPILVRSDPGGAPERYEIIAGERRWRAAQRASLHEVPIIVRDADDKTSLELAIVENVQRADLNPLEEAMGYQKLIDEHEYTQNDLGQVIGKSRSHVANSLRLLKLPTQVQTLVSEGVLSSGHARTLVTADDPLSVAKAIVKDGLSVRQAEKLAQKQKDGSSKSDPTEKARSSAAQKDANILALEKALTNALGLIVNLNSKTDGSGELTIKYKTLEQLDDLCRKMGTDL